VSTPWYLADITIAKVPSAFTLTLDILLFIALGTLESLGQASKIYFFYTAQTANGHPISIMLRHHPTITYVNGLPLLHQPASTLLACPKCHRHLHCLHVIMTIIIIIVNPLSLCSSPSFLKLFYFSSSKCAYEVWDIYVLLCQFPFML
jgi:hypothetical protein